MAHTCATCGQYCTCQGDWDDIDFGETFNCCHCVGVDGEDDDDDNMDYNYENPEDDDDDDLDQEEEYPGAITADDICRECGCHELMACTHPDHGACWWTEAATSKPDGSDFMGPLCSHCAMKLENVNRPWQNNPDDADQLP